MIPSILSQGGAAGFYFPPLHPIFVDFTAALIPISFLFDLAGAWLKRESLLAAGWWTLLAAVLITPVTVALGWIWMDSMGGVDHWAMPWHFWIGIGLGIALFPLAAWRGWRYWRKKSPGWIYVLPALAVLFTLLVQGDLGGAMSLGQGVVFTTPSAHNFTGTLKEGDIEWKTHLELRQ